MPDGVKEQKVPATEPKEAEVQPKVDAQPKEQQEGLPEDASERTKREFEKLKKHNQELADKLAEKEAKQPPKPSLLDQYITQPVVPQPKPQAQVMPAAPVVPNLSQAKVEEIKKRLWDEEGTIDGEELQRRLSLAEQAEVRAKEAERKAQAALEKVARYEVDTQKKLLYAEYPELDPSNKDFNEEAYDLVRKEMVDQLWSSGAQDVMTAAQKMSKYWKKSDESKKQEQTLKERRAVTSKTVSGNPDLAAKGDYETLRKQSLHSKEAMEERIRRSGL